MFELDTGLACSELPRNGGAALVALSFQRLDSLLQGLFVRHRAGEAATLKNADLDLSLVEPAAMLGRGMELQPIQDRAGLRWGKVS